MSRYATLGVFKRWFQSIRRCQHYDPQWHRQCERPLGHEDPHGV